MPKLKNSSLGSGNAVAVSRLLVKLKRRKGTDASVAGRKAKSRRALQGPRTSLIGQRFSRLVVLSLCENRNACGICLWHCACDCGDTTDVPTNRLNGGITQSCGCLQKERVSESRFLHGRGKSREYATWAGMKGRCYNPDNASFPDYGSRGITVCASWRNSFVNFLTDMGDCPPGKCIERIDNNKGYYKANCKWATRAEQAVNKRNTRFLMFRGERMCVSAWAKRLGVDHRLIRDRLKAGWTKEESLTTPVKTIRLPRPRNTVAT